MFDVELVPAAARQIAAARDWWLEHRDKAPSAFDDDFSELLDVLSFDPSTVGARVVQRPGVRRVLLRRIRYYVYFRAAERTVTILAVWHASRGTSPEM